MEGTYMKIFGILSIALMVSVAFLSGCLDPGEDDKNPVGYKSQYTGMNEYVNSSNEFSFEM